MYVSKLAIALFLVVAGYLLSKTKLSRINDFIVKILFYVVIPMNVFYNIVLTEAFTAYLKTTLGAIIHLVSVYALAIAIFPKILKCDSKCLVTAILLASLPNVVFLPLTLMSIMYGDTAPVTPYSIAFSIILATFTPLIIVKYGKDFPGKLLNLKKVIKEMLLFPPTGTFMVALALRFVIGFELVLKEPLLDYFYRNVNELNLLAFMIIGSSINFSKIVVNKSILALVMLWRYVISLITGLTLANLLNLEGVWFTGMVIQSLMPPAVTNIILAKTYNLNEEITSTLIIMLTPISVIIVIPLFLLSI